MTAAASSTARRRRSAPWILLLVLATVDPAGEGQQVAISYGGLDVATVVTDAAGAFSTQLVPQRNGDVVARLVSDGSLSEPAPVVVRPALTVARDRALPFLRTRVVLKVTPSWYGGAVTGRLWHRGRQVASVRGVCRDGRCVLRVPTPGIDWFTLKLSLAATAELGARQRDVRYEAQWRRLARGSRGPRVRGVLLRLAALKVLTPGSGESFTGRVADAVMAFQKAYRLRRDYVVDYADWRKLESARVLRPRHASPSLHLEVDKTRQILMVVKGGKVWRFICVSTGATGNTPEGAFRIRTKYPYTTSGYGGILYRTMGFVGNFAIHGYVPVPPYPASHGCVREPMWAAPWVYDRSFVGERLYIYR